MPGERSSAFEAIAAGGGLTGSAFALELARQGAKVAVIERAAGPHHKVCGEFLSDRAQDLLRYLGIDVSGLGASTVETLCLANGARVAAAPLPFKAAGLSRFVLDEALIDAVERAGAEVIRSTAIDGLQAEGDTVRVRTARGVFECRAAALASGKHNIRGLQRPAGRMAGFKIHLHPTGAARAALTRKVHLAAFSGGYFGLCLIEEDILSMAWIIDADVLKAVGSSWAAQSAYFSRQSPLFAELVSDAEPSWDKPLAVSAQPYGFVRHEVIAPSIYPVGDQLAVIPSFAGDGMALALASGIRAARAVLKGESAAVFQAGMIANYKPQFRRAAALDLIIGSAMLRRVGIAGARLMPGAVTAIVAATRLRGVDEITAARSG